MQGIGYAVFFAHGGAVDQLVGPSGLAGLELEHVVADQLAVVFVGGDHVDVGAFVGAPEGHGADNVVGFVAGNHQRGKPEGVTQLLQGLEGVDHQLRSLVAVGLVGRIHDVAEGASRRIEGHGQMGRMLTFNQFQDVFRETIEDGHVGAFRVDHRPSQEGVVHLEDKGVPVDEE